MTGRTRISRTISSSGNRGTYDIYLVGFPHAESRPPATSLLSREISPADWIQLVPHIAPEANVFDFLPFSGTISSAEDYSPDVSKNPSPLDSAASYIGAEDGDAVDSCSAQELIQYEARRLLDMAKEPDPTSTQSEWRPIIFAGYQLGGIVVQQAMVICNNDPKYHDIALRTYKLVIVETPCHECDLATWERILDNMILTSNIEIKGKRSAVLGKLATSVHEMVAYFQGGVNYQVEYLPPESQKGQISVSGLRALFSPKILLKDYFWDTEPLDARSFYSDLLDFMQLLSPTTRLIYHSPAWQMMSEDLVLELYTHITSDLPLDQRYIQIIGPPGHGKATILKYIVRKAMRSAKRGLLLDLGLKPFERADLDVPALLQHYIHQIISQCPELFSQIRPFYLECYKMDEVANVERLWTFLHILLRASKGWKLVFAVNNIHLKSEVVQSSLGKFEQLLEALQSDYLIVASSAQKITGSDTRATSLVLDLELDDTPRRSSIQATFRKVLFAQSAIRGLNLPMRFQNLRIPELVSISHAERYAALLSRSFLLSTIETVDVALRDCPRTEASIFDYCVQSLDTRLLPWCSMIVSWVCRSIRPLQIDELAVAITLCGEPLKMAELAPRIPRSLEYDIRRYLDLVLRINDNLVYFHSANTKEFLNEQTSKDERGNELELLDHGKIVRYCLQYLTDVLSGESESTYTTQMSWRDQLKDHHNQHAELQFLDYVVRHWPAHYRAQIQLDHETHMQDVQSQYSNFSPLESEMEPGDVHSRVLAFLNDDTLRNRWYQLYRSKKVTFTENTSNTSALEVATELGFTFLVNILLSNSTSELSKPTRPTSDVFPDLGMFLAIAIRQNHSQLLDMFLKTGARREAAILAAASHGYVNYLEILCNDELLKYNPWNLLESAFYWAARGGSLSCVEYCAEKNINWDWKDNGGSSIIHAAAVGGKVEILEFITKGRKLDINSQDNTGRSPLIIATHFNHVPFVEALCNMGADPTLCDNDGKTALHLAITRDPTIVTALLRRNASPTSPDSKKQTPLHYACALGNSGIVSQLVEALGPEESVDIRNGDNKTPLDIVAASGNSALVSLLLYHNANPALEIGNEQGPISLAVSGGHLDVFKALYFHLYSRINDTSREALVMQAVSMGQLLIVRFTVKRVTNANFHFNGESPLAVASSKGYTEIVRLLLHLGANPNFLDKSDLSPLYRAVQGRHADVVDVLLSYKADPNALNQERWGPLHYAVSQGMIEIVEILLKSSASVNQRTDLKNTPLHLAVAYPEVVKALLRYKPELAAPGFEAKTPLHLAVAGRHIRTVELLIREDQTLAHITRYGHITAVHDSIEGKPSDTEILELLCPEGKLDSNQGCYQEIPPLIHALRHSNLSVARFLLARRPEMAALKDRDDISTLHIAAEKGYVDILDELLQAYEGLDVNGRTRGGLTPLHFASTRSDDRAARKLIDFGANVNAVCEDGQTPLYNAAESGNLSIVQCLLEANADTEICNTSAWSPLHVAIGSAPILEALLTHKADIEHADGSGWTALLSAAEWGSSQGLEMLLKWNANVQAVDDDGQTALHLTEQEGLPILSQMLLEAKANVNVTDNTGKTPLHYLAMRKQGDRGPDKLRQLLEFGANVCPADSQGNTPLHYAAFTPDEPHLIEALIEAIQQRNLSIDMKNDKQQTPLHRSLINGKYDQFKRLLDKGASLRERDIDGNSCLALASGPDPDSKKKVEWILGTERNDRESGSLWTLNDKITSFQLAAQTDLPTALAIAKYDSRIFQVEDDTYTVLRRCLDSGRRDIAAEFLELGASPFRHKAGQLSVFQDVMRLHDEPLVMACLKQLDRDEPDQYGMFQVLATTSDERWWPDQSRMILKFEEKFTQTQITDHDGWSIHHFAYQHQTASDGFIAEGKGMPTPKSATRFTMPKHWMVKNNLRDYHIKFLPDNYVSFMGQTTESRVKISIRSDHPFPPRRTSSNKQYFEVQIMPKTDTGDDSTAVVGIGLCGEFVDEWFYRVQGPTVQPFYLQH